jgi:hypothetical protein
VIFSLLHSKWPLIEQLYEGSCARYLTLSKLRSTLLHMGIAAELDGPRENPMQQLVSSRE